MQEVLQLRSPQPQPSTLFHPLMVLPQPERSGDNKDTSSNNSQQLTAKSQEPTANSQQPAASSSQARQHSEASASNEAS
ncbi:hypothetical protein AWZ03_014797 [Drosophila navojoa]|uniref:Uncharacterized protein n=1 Tax=Drosophila navojoa TaxID=7232 RepID=A0A484AT39_DRONA|nr:hypothetical protein AWZ03_014797 [Drosophila navojoa]